MKITALETIHLPEYPSILFVAVHTDAGLVGYSDTCYMPDAIAGFIHGFAAPMLIGHDPLDIELHWRRLYEVIAPIVGKVSNSVGSVHPVLEAEAGDLFEVLAIRGEEKRPIGECDGGDLAIRGGDVDSIELLEDVHGGIVEGGKVKWTKELEQPSESMIGANLSPRLPFFRDCGNPPAHLLLDVDDRRANDLFWQ